MSTSHNLPLTFIDIWQVDTLSFLSFCDTCHCRSEQTSNNTFSKIQFVEDNKFLIFCSFVEVIPTFSFGWFLVKFHPKMETFIPSIMIVWTTWPMKSIPWNARGISKMKNNNIKFLKLMTWKRCLWVPCYYVIRVFFNLFLIILNFNCVEGGLIMTSPRGMSQKKSLESFLF